MAFCEVLVRFWVTGSQKKLDVIILKKLGILVPSSFKYSTLKPTKPWAINLFLNLFGTLSKLITIPFTFGSADRTPQSLITVLIWAGLIYKVYIPSLLNSFAGSFKLYAV